jgi:hypothetical protein
MHGFGWPASVLADSRLHGRLAATASSHGAGLAGIRCQRTQPAGKGRKISNWWANLETLWMGIGDSLFGFRVYPVEPLRRIMQRQHWMRRFDFDPEAVVRLCWAGVPPLNVPSPVKYFQADEGGVSHFNYWRDNRLLTWMHIRLMFGFALRLPLLLWRKLRHG